MSHKIIKINPRYAEYAEQIEKIIDGHRPEDAKVIFKHRNTLYTVTIGGIKMVVKDFKLPNFLNSFVYTTLRKSKARRSFENALKMLELGFDTPAPVAYGEVRDGLKLTCSYYISEEKEVFTEMRHWELYPNASELLPAFAKEMLRLYNAGIYNRDFTGGNILYTQDDKGAYKFSYVDLNRIEFDVHCHKKLMRMFHALNLNMEETKKLARIFAGTAQFDPDVTEREAEKQLNKYFAHQRLKKRLKKLRGK